MSSSSKKWDRTIAFTHISNLILLQFYVIAELARLRQGWKAKMAKTTPKAKNSAFMKPMQPSEHLAKIVGTEPLPRTEVTKKIWAHIKKHDLQNPKNKREILADDKLQPIFGSKKLDMFQMTKAVNKHLK